MSMLERIGSPEDVKQLSMKELRALAEEVRTLIIDTVRKNGGHLASNLGVIELTIALHRVYDSPKDALVWDVGHQTYAHKLLTGRKDGFSRIRQRGGLSGFPKRSESPHDIFETGHSSTSISSALGLLEARKRKGIEGKVVALIGDGALTAGLAFEALSNVAQLGLPLIVVLNDNKMSISHNVGALSRYLSKLSTSLRYQTFRRKIDALVESIPHFGPHLMDFMVRSKRAVKAIFFKDNFFSDLGFEYIGPIAGHNLPVLVQALGRAKRLDRPVVVHVVTTKGKGFEKAEDDPEAFHGVSPYCSDALERRPSFTEVFGSLMARLAQERQDVVAITAAMSKGTGLESMAKKFPSRVYDVGIAEQHAVTFAAGLAAGGLRPVVALYSTFLQRAMDQVIHDVALPNLPVVLAIDRSGAVGEDGETHQGFFDIPLLKALPNMAILAPSSAKEMESFLRLALERSGPTAIRYPKARIPCEEDFDAAKVEWGRGVFARRRSLARVLVCALGPLSHSASKVSDELAEKGILVDVYSLRFANSFDEEYLVSFCSQYAEIIVIEDGAVSGGVGESISAILQRHAVGARTRLIGFGSVPAPQASREELLEEAGLGEAELLKVLEKIAAPAGGTSVYDKSTLVARW
jgi:1-deoxy-D-xylulose-5-phosphate synthase